MLAGGALSAANRAYVGAITKIDEADAKIPSQGLAPTPPPVVPPAPPVPVMQASPDLLTDEGRKPRAIPNQSELTQSIRTTELMVLLLSALFATLLGLSLLYVPNETWGSIGDLIVAVLWGAGIYQITGQTVQGYRGVQTSLTGP
jgi:hypothetical protein